MTLSVRQILEQAAGTGEVIRIIYHAGSQPGSAREVIPIAVTAVDLSAYDLASGTKKQFKLDKVALPEPGVTCAAYDPSLSSPAKDARSIKAVLEGSLDELHTLGWHVVASEASVCLCRLFRNGKPRKTPDVQLSYDEFVVDYVDDDDGLGLTELRRKSMLPYHVRSQGAETRSFGSMASALPLFWNEARRLAPEQPGT